MRGTDELVFVPLGGLGEIGMNFALYGLGPKGDRKWLLVDCGVTFAGPQEAGIDIIVPDPRYLGQIQRNIVAGIITHAHEDHIGAVADLWPWLKCPLYATPFAAGLFEARGLNDWRRSRSR